MWKKGEVVLIGRLGEIFCFEEIGIMKEWGIYSGYFYMGIGYRNS